MRGRLDGLTAVVNGAGAGIGRAIAVEFAREGASIVVNDFGTLPTGEQVEPDRAIAVVEAIRSMGGDAIADGGDIGDLDDAHVMIERALSAWGKLDILVNCAGWTRYGSPSDTAPEDFDALLRVHLRGYFNTTSVAARHWIERGEYGRLINFGSKSSDGLPHALGYATAKAGVGGFTRSCANALVAYGVTSNCVRPLAATSMVDMVPTFQRSGRRPSVDSIGTSMDPRNVTPLVVFLASPAAAHVTGRTFDATGGRYTLLSEPSPERVVTADFLSDPATVYEELECTLCAGLDITDLPAPMPPLSELGDWKAEYGAALPRWTFDSSR
jgi:3-oxoacyl-[acyl-carrier protein] reductase